MDRILVDSQRSNVDIDTLKLTLFIKTGSTLMHQQLTHMHQPSTPQRRPLYIMEIVCMCVCVCDMSVCGVGVCVFCVCLCVCVCVCIIIKK